MSVEIRFEPDGPGGLVAEGTYLWAAAKRLGLRVPADCEGRGECDTCAVVVEKGAALLSPLTEAERSHLSPSRLAAGERLACQVKVDTEGAVVVRPVPAIVRAGTANETVKDVRKEFRQLPLKRKLATLIELEAVTLIQALDAVINVPVMLGEKVMNVMAGRGRTLEERARAVHHPAEHCPPEPRIVTSEPDLSSQV